jgi:hypothetical protein
MADIFLIFWLVVWLTICGGMLIAFNFDRVAVFILDLLGVQVYGTASMIAAMLRQSPQEWTVKAPYTLTHPALGEIRGSGPKSLSVTGPFGEWEPDFIERRIIWDAMVWYRSEYIRSLVLRRILNG